MKNLMVACVPMVIATPATKRICPGRLRVSHERFDVMILQLGVQRRCIRFNRSCLHCHPLSDKTWSHIAHGQEALVEEEYDAQEGKQEAESC